MAPDRLEQERRLLGLARLRRKEAILQARVRYGEDRSRLQTALRHAHDKAEAEERLRTKVAAAHGQSDEQTDAARRIVEDVEALTEYRADRRRH